MDPFDFDNQELAPADITFTFRGEPYILKEADEAAVIAYRATMSRGTTIDDSVVNLSSHLASADSVLVAHCVYKKDSKEHVDVDLIRSWPHRVVDPLYKKIKEISGIDEEDTVEKVDKAIAKLQKKKDHLIKKGTPAKNSPSATPSTSV